MNPSDLLTVTQAAEEIPALNECQIRMLIKRNTDGFDDECVVRIGRSVYIDRGRLGRWLDKRRMAA